MLINKAKENVEEWTNATQQVRGQNSSSTSHPSPQTTQWTRPDPGFMKINVDGSFHLQERHVGAG